MLDRLGRQLYHPALMLPLVALVQLMVALDFNFGQLALILLSKGMQYTVHTVFHHSNACLDTYKRAARPC